MNFALGVVLQIQTLWFFPGWYMSGTFFPFAIKWWLWFYACFKSEVELASNPHPIVFLIIETMTFAIMSFSLILMVWFWVFQGIFLLYPSVFILKLRVDISPGVSALLQHFSRPITFACTQLSLLDLILEYFTLLTCICTCGTAIYHHNCTIFWNLDTSTWSFLFVILDKNSEKLVEYLNISFWCCWLVSSTLSVGSLHFRF